MKLWDFSGRFARVADAWIEKNRKQFAFDVLEDKIPDLYIKWLNTPASWLNGDSPVSYFERFRDPDQLIALLCAYCEQDIAIPDPLQDRILSFGTGMRDRLFAVLRSDDAALKARTAAAALLNNIGLTKDHADVLLSMLLEEALPGALTEPSVELTRLYGSEERLLAEMEKHAEDAFGPLLLDILIDVSEDQRLVSWACDGLLHCPAQRMTYVSYLLRIGDPAAIEPLQRIQRLPETGYIEFQELGNAIEALGGESAPMREFAGDADYEALRARPGEN